MGINYKKTTHGKVGDIIYPAYNGSNGCTKHNQWHLVTQVKKDGLISGVKVIHDFATVRAIQLMQQVYNLKARKTIFILGTIY